MAGCNMKINPELVCSGSSLNKKDSCMEVFHMGEQVCIWDVFKSHNIQTTWECTREVWTFYFKQVISHKALLLIWTCGFGGCLHTKFSSQPLGKHGK